MRRVVEDRLTHCIANLVGQRDSSLSNAVPARNTIRSTRVPIACARIARILASGQNPTFDTHRLGLESTEAVWKPPAPDAELFAKMHGGEEWLIRA